MRVMTFVTLSTALLMSTPAVAETKASTAEPAQKEASKAAPAPKKICKRLATTGSRMEEKVCLTKEEWKLVEKEVEE